MGIQLFIAGKHMRAAGFVAKTDVQYGWDDDNQCETELEYPYWVSPDGDVIGSYDADNLCIDWNAWGGNRERFADLLEQYHLLSLGVQS